MKNGEGGHLYDVYIRAVGQFDMLADYIIFESLNGDGDSHPAVQRLAKVLVNLKGIMRLCSTCNFYKGWSLSKLLWASFMDLRMLDNDFVEGKLHDKDLEDNEENGSWGSANETDTQFADERYDSFKREKLMGLASRTRQMGKELNLDFIYAHGYSGESLIKSPYMMMDRNEVEDTIESIDENTYENEVELLHEACLLTCLIMNETMNKSALEWKWVIFDYLKGQYDFLEKRIDKSPIDFEMVKMQCEKDATKKQ